MKSKVRLLALILFLFSTPLFSQVTVSIEITGVNKTLEDNIRLFLSVEQQKNQPLLSEGRLRRLQKKAPDEIARALQPFGYYRATVRTELTQSSVDSWVARYEVDLGPPIRIGEFDLVISDAMRNDPAFELLINDFPLKKGVVLNHLEYENIKSSLARLASERGYFRARFVDHRIEIDLQAYEARVYLNYDGGPRFLFGEVDLQQDVINDSLLKRYIPFETGKPYNLDQLIDLQQALNDSDYFQSVEIAPGLADATSDTIPIAVTLTPRKRHRLSIGLGYGSDTGARAKLGWQMPRLNTKGHRLDSELKVSQLGYTVGTHYSVPIRNPRTDQLVYSAGVINEDTDSNESTVRTVGISLKRSRGIWRESISLNYQQEDFIVANVSGSSTLLMPGASWSRTWGNNFINVIDGLRFDITMRGASDKVMSDTNFFQMQGGIKGITSLSQNNRLLLRGNLGSIWTDSFQQLPSSVRFFAGGSQSVRGYSYQSLGPVDGSGRVVGGKNLMVGSIEYEHSFSDLWGMALFYDGGNAIDDLSEKLERGGGFGFRWKSPVGPVRIDFASALSQPGQPWRVHITIGPDL